MATIERIQQTAMPSVSRSGTNQGSYSVSWEIDTDRPTNADHALALAQGLAAPIPSGLKAIPIRGDVLATDNGICEPAITAVGLAGWVAADAANRSGDGGAIALDEQCQPREEGPTKQFVASVTFRAPSAGRFELPRFLSQFSGGLSSSDLPTAPTAPTIGTQVSTKLKDFPREFHIDYVTKDATEQFVFPVFHSRTLTRPGLKRVRLVNPNGELYPAFQEIDRLQIVTVEQLVGDDKFPHQLNALYNKTMNNRAITFQSQTIPAYHARFLAAETSRTQSEGGSEYKVLSYRVEIHPQYDPRTEFPPLFEVKPATGSYYLKEIGDPNLTPGPINPNTIVKLIDGKRRYFVKVQEIDDDGLPIANEYPLTNAGTLARYPNQQAYSLYTRYKAVPYNFLLGTT